MFNFLGYDGIKNGRKSGFGGPTSYYSCGEPELPISPVDEYQRQSYQDSIVKQTSSGKVHVTTVTYPSASSEVVPYVSSSSTDGKRMPQSTLHRSVSNLSHNQLAQSSSSLALESQQKTDPNVDTKSNDTATPTASTNPAGPLHNLEESSNDDDDRSKVNKANNNNIMQTAGKPSFQEDGNLLGACGSSESQCFKRDLHVKQRGGSEQNNGDLSLGMDSRRLTVDSGICLCGHDTEVVEKHATSTTTTKVQQHPLEHSH